MTTMAARGTTVNAANQLKRHQFRFCELCLLQSRCHSVHVHSIGVRPSNWTKRKLNSLRSLGVKSVISTAANSRTFTLFLQYRHFMVLECVLVCVCVCVCGSCGAFVFRCCSSCSCDGDGHHEVSCYENEVPRLLLLLRPLL